MVNGSLSSEGCNLYMGSLPKGYKLESKGCGMYVSPLQIWSVVVVEMSHYPPNMV